MLCAFSADGSAAELLEPPAQCAPGERVTIEGVAGEPEKQLNPKKKIWEKVQPTLSTSASRVVQLNGELPFMTSGGPCTVKSIANGNVG